MSTTFEYLATTIEQTVESPLPEWVVLALHAHDLTTIASREGHCYKVCLALADFAAAAGVQINIVHGSVLNEDGERHPHAWVEQGDVVFLTSHANLVSFREFKRVNTAKRHRVYSARQVCRLAEQEDTCGPWHKEPFGKVWYQS